MYILSKFKGTSNLFPDLNYYNYYLDGRLIGMVACGETEFVIHPGLFFPQSLRETRGDSFGKSRHDTLLNAEKQLIGFLNQAFKTDIKEIIVLTEEPPCINYGMHWIDKIP